jgi:hypothetical protein
MSAEQHLSPAVREILRREQEKRWQREAEAEAEVARKRKQADTWMRQGVYGEQERAARLERHMAKRALFELGPEALNVTINRPKR